MLLLAAALAGTAIPAATGAQTTKTAAATSRPALLHSEPAQGEETRGVPIFMRLRFNQPMRLERLKVYDSDGAEQAMRLNRDAANPSLEHRGGFVQLRPGRYRVEWAAASPAGESIAGTLSFEAKEREQARPQR